MDVFDMTPELMLCHILQIMLYQFLNVVHVDSGPIVLFFFL